MLTPQIEAAFDKMKLKEACALFKFQGVNLTSGERRTRAKVIEKWRTLPIEDASRLLNSASFINTRYFQYIDALGRDTLASMLNSAGVGTEGQSLENMLPIFFALPFESKHNLLKMWARVPYQPGSLNEYLPGISLPSVHGDTVSELSFATLSRLLTNVGVEMPPQETLSIIDLRQIFNTLSLEVQKEIVDSVPLTGGNRKRDFDEFILDFVAPVETDLHEQTGRKAHWVLPSPKRLKVVDDSDLNSNQFLRAVDSSVITDVANSFIRSTSNDALRKGTCCVCARRLLATTLQHMHINDIPSPDKLAPSHPHPAQILHGCMLLHPQAVVDDLGYLCNDCLRALHHKTTPTLSLANNMWIGNVPPELDILTLPERVLIARYFPAAYIIKLYPKNRGVHLDPRHLTSGVKGNVTTYPLDVEGLADFVRGTKLPHPPTILSATIGITFVGVNNIPERALRGIFSVSRDRIRSALQWLQSNNPIYADITIDEPNLALLPEDDVPIELRQVVRADGNGDVLETEHAGYLPNDDEDIALFHDSELTPAYMEDNDELPQKPEVVPLQAHGMMDTDASSVTDSMLMSAAMDHVAKRLGQYERVNIKHGSEFVNEYPRLIEGTRDPFPGTVENPNHLLGAFPVLFPYGAGGFEVDRPIPISYQKHAQWALEYSDNRFRSDLQLIFQIFGVLMKRQIFSATVFQIRQSTYQLHADEISRLTAADFTAAALEEGEGLPISNPTVKLFRKQLTALRSKVMGTDESRRSIRAQIWGCSIVHGPPSIWMTINPSDIHDPVAQVLAGVEIDLDNFMAERGPDNATRAFNIANDPFAAAEFFHLTIRTLLRDILGISAVDLRGSNRIKRKPGIFGEVRAYVGTVEAQGRGMLHLHLFLWLVDAPTSQQMAVALKGEAFREKIRMWIAQNITADIGGLSTAQIEALPKKNNVSFSRPEAPGDTPYEKQGLERIKTLARSLLVHVCKGHGCLLPGLQGGKCKRSAPFACAEEAWVNEEGEWGPKRIHPYVVGHNQTCLLLLRCNHDVKLLTNANDTRGIVWYITIYATKKQQKSTNASAVLAKRLVYHTKQERRNDQVDELNRRMLNRCANALSREQEFSAPEVVGYLMGWGDRYISHHFVTIYWDSVVFLLKAEFPSLRGQSYVKYLSHHLKFSPSTCRYRQQVGLVDKQEESRVLGQDRIRNLHPINGSLGFKDQPTQYTSRSEELSHLNFWDFHLETYEYSDQRVNNKNGARTIADGLLHPLPGSRKEKGRRVRRPGHETLPEFIGQWFPRRSDASTRELYCASMLALFKPWREVADLRGADETFEESFQVFLQDALPEWEKAMDNIEYYYLSAEAAKIPDSKASLGPVDRLVAAGIEETMDSSFEDNADNNPNFEITADHFEQARMNIYTARDHIFAIQAMQIAYDCGIFSEGENPKQDWQTEAKPATLEEVATHAVWEDLVKSYIRGQVVESVASELQPTLPSLQSMAQAPEIISPDPSPEAANEVTQPALQLNTEQARAYTIIQKHMRDTMDLKAPQQLLMIVDGCGGTGKSALIEAITKTTIDLGIPSWLSKTATSGVAATRIGGTTLHSWAGLGIALKVDVASTTTLGNRATNMRATRYLIIDEFSMVTKQMLEALSQVCCQTKCKMGNCTNGVFGGVNIILFGDLHQFPPVNKKGALYVIPAEGEPGCLGQHIFEQFTTVVTLTEQMRVTDIGWTAMLLRLRVGGCTAEDVQMLNEMVLSNPKCQVPNFDCAPWNDAVLVTSRNSVRDMWNEAAVKRHSRNAKEPIYICPALDSVGTTNAPLDPYIQLQIAALGVKQTGRLATRTVLAIGMKAMVLLNIATQADLANGTRGTVRKIFLDPREEVQIGHAHGEVALQYPPSCVVLELEHCSFPQIDGLQPKEIPIFPSQSSFHYITSRGEKLSIKRRQLAITPAYAFTDYKAQGQTIEYVLVDLAESTKNALDPFHAYVSLSRSRGRDNIRLFRECPKRLLTEHPSQDLQPEDTRLALLGRETEVIYNKSNKYNM